MTFTTLRFRLDASRDTGQLVDCVSQLSQQADACRLSQLTQSTN